MDTFAPEFAQYWLTGQAGDADIANPDRDNAETASQQAALVELAERVTAARSVV
jgi:hypothetical protein